MTFFEQRQYLVKIEYKIGHAHHWDWKSHLKDAPPCLIWAEKHYDRWTLAFPNKACLPAIGRNYKQVSVDLRPWAWPRFTNKAEVPAILLRTGNYLRQTVARTLWMHAWKPLD